MSIYHLYTDGGARGNPGPAATGAVLFDSENNLVEFDATYLGETTNNMAEYEALLLGLSIAIKNNVEELVCFLDSELIVMQVNGAYQVKNKALKEKYKKIKVLKESFKSIKFAHVRREKNKFADKLVNVVLDGRSD